MSIILPRLVIRDRRPPPLRATARLEGWARWELINRRGRVTRAGEQHNLILNQGLDQVATYGFRDGVFAWTKPFAYLAVGTNNTAAAVTDTGLGAEVDRTDNTSADDTVTRVSDGVYDIVRTFEFDFAEAIGNLTEWGLSPLPDVAGNLAVRELFKDSGGTPETVTKTSDDKLRVVYTRRITLTPTTFTAGSLVVTDLGALNGDYRLLGGDSSGRTGLLDLWAAHHLAVGEEPPGATFSQSWNAPALYLSSIDRSGAAYSDVIPGGSAIGGDNQALGMELHAAAAAYTPGSYSRTGVTIKFPTSQGNMEQHALCLLSVGSVLASGGPATGLVFDYDPGDEWTKDDLHEFRVTLPTITWARA